MNIVNGYCTANVTVLIINQDSMVWCQLFGLLVIVAYFFKLLVS